MKKWTIKDIEENIKTNVTDYGSMVVVAFLFKKLYGRFPKCGMSGAQAEFADGVVKRMPGKVSVG
jgi:hypothetical protein